MRDLADRRLHLRGAGRHGVDAGGHRAGGGDDLVGLRGRGAGVLRHGLGRPVELGRRTGQPTGGVADQAEDAAERVQGRVE